MLKVIITDGLAENGQALLSSQVQVDDRTGISPQELARVVGNYDAMIVRSRTKVTAPLIQSASRLKVIGRAGVGVDNIDLQQARLNGITVVNAPNASTLAVAEHTLGLLFALARAIPRADRTMKDSAWIKKELRGVELCGKTLGIIGVGRIGSETARLARAVGMRVMGYDPYVPLDTLGERDVIPSERVQPIYDAADFLSYHVPLTAETRGIVNAESFTRMKPGVYLVCTARGGVINEDALLTALESGRVAGAALDVFAVEPPGESPLVQHPRVIATPHIGASTDASVARMSEMAARNLVAVLEGGAPEHIVNPEVLASRSDP